MKAQIIEHKGDTFAKILELDGINKNDFLKSINLESNIDSIF